MKPMRVALAVIAMWLIPVSLSAQAKIGIVDMEKAVIGCAAGQKAEAQYNARADERSKDLDRRKKEIDDANNKLKTQDKILSASAKADLTKSVDRMQTDLNRVTDDAQKELDDLKNDLLRPIAEVADRVIGGYSAQMGYTLIIDISSPQNQSLVYYDPGLDITPDIMKLIDSEIAQAPPAPKVAAPAAPTAPAAPKTTPAPTPAKNPPR